MKEEKKIIADKVRELAESAKESGLKNVTIALYTLAGALYGLDDELLANAVNKKFADHAGNERNHSLSPKEEAVFNKLIEIQKQAEKTQEYNASSVLLCIISAIKMNFEDELAEFVTRFREEVLQPKLKADSEKRKTNKEIIMHRIKSIAQKAEKAEIYSALRVIRAIEQTIKNDNTYSLAATVNKFGKEILQPLEDTGEINPKMDTDKENFMKDVTELAELAEKLEAYDISSILFYLCGAMQNNIDNLLSDEVRKFMQ